MNRFFAILTLLVVVAGCQTSSNAPQAHNDVFGIQRRNMVRWDLREQGIKSEAVLQAMTSVPRHLFLPDNVRSRAYDDEDLPIGPFITTPRPFVVGKTIELLDLKSTDKVLEIGTGRGYQSALLGDIAKEVFTIEIVPEVASEAEETLTLLHFKNVHCKTGDGFQGWAEHAPYNAVLVMASAPKVPQPLLDQLAIGGRLVMPVGAEKEQSLILYRKTEKGLKQETIMPIRVRAMEGEARRNQTLP